LLYPGGLRQINPADIQSLVSLWLFGRKVINVADLDPGSGAFLTPGSGMGKRSGSGMKHPDHISKSLQTIFWVEIPVLKFLDANPGWKKFESGINIPAPQH
jgi:hypothetical protein